MNNAYWNSTLRYGISYFDITSETSYIVKSGLVTLNLSDNNMNGKSMNCLVDAIKTNFWFLGDELPLYVVYITDIAYYVRVKFVEKSNKYK